MDLAKVTVKFSKDSFQGVKVRTFTLKLMENLDSILDTNFTKPKNVSGKEGEPINNAND
jgi:hypothetical protein